MEKYFIYLITNNKRTVLFAGMTNDLGEELTSLYQKKGSKKSFPTKNNCYQLVYFEKSEVAHLALSRLKEMREMNRQEQENLIRSINPMWKFLNDQITKWPPKSRVDLR